MLGEKCLFMLLAGIFISATAVSGDETNEIPCELCKIHPDSTQNVVVCQNNRTLCDRAEGCWVLETSIHTLKGCLNDLIAGSDFYPDKCTGFWRNGFCTGEECLYCVGGVSKATRKQNISCATLIGTFILTSWIIVTLWLL